MPNAKWFLVEPGIFWAKKCFLRNRSAITILPWFYNKTWTPLTILVRLFIFWFAECRNFVHSSGLWGMLFIFFLFSDCFFLFSFFWSTCLFLLVGLSLSPQTSWRNGRSHTGKWSCRKGCFFYMQNIWQYIGYWSCSMDLESAK